MIIIDEQGNQLVPENLDYGIGYLTKSDNETYIYHHFTSAQLAESQIPNLKYQLAETDWIANKLAEAVAEFVDTGDNSKVSMLRIKYAKQLDDRENWRNEINRLESIIQGDSNGN